jgi:prevent-host-death family protein
MKSISIDEFKRKTAAVLDSLKTEPSPYLVTRRGEAQAVLIGLSEWERVQSILATWEEELDPGSLPSLKRAIEDIQQGRLTPHEEVVKAYRR